MKSEWISFAAIAAIFLLVFPLLWRLINFADRNPQAALFEGAEFLVHEQILSGSKYNPVIPIEAGSLREEHPVELPPGEVSQLDQPDEVQRLLPPESEEAE